MTDHTELIAHLEAATEGSRELDLEIEKAMQWCDPTARLEADDDLHWNEPYEFGSSYAYQPLSALLHKYTTSIDAALTLLPKGFAIRNFIIWPGIPSTLTLLETHKGKDELYWHRGRDSRWEVQGATPALALCIAALKAREV